MSRTSPRILLPIPSTDPLRRIYRLADSRGGTLESPAGRSFDSSAEGAMTTGCPPLSLIICPCLSLLSFALYYPVRSYVRICVHISTVLSSLSACRAVLSIVSKGVYKHPSVKRIATGRLYINQTCWYPLSLIPLLLSFGGVRFLSPPNWGMWIPCPRTNTPRESVEAPSVFQTSFLEAMLGELGRLSCLETRHGAFSSTVRRRILAANISPGGFSAARLWKAPRDGRLTRAPREL